MEGLCFCCHEEEREWIGAMSSDVRCLGGVCERDRGMDRKWIAGITAIGDAP